jgi:hypothetical protein
VKNAKGYDSFWVKEETGSGNHASKYYQFGQAGDVFSRSDGWSIRQIKTVTNQEKKGSGD